MKNFSLKKFNNKLEPVQICLLGNMDMFGLEELMEENKTRQFTVICTQSNSQIYYFPKDAMNEVQRTNGSLIIDYIEYWNDFVN